MMIMRLKFFRTKWCSDKADIKFGKRFRIGPWVGDCIWNAFGCCVMRVCN